ncbi:hypothetical protein BCR39DRAFT_589637 [Naematelia encephala]|uniref:RlpA-like double-psi beta-barrel-protein domain-containing protein-containing protein n=1 Tax=Naematelia encephala TaxID=71784 RepID=A0A1Y2AX34_9TREE|nr:hypothetical protein BCR39DRAFT_589637 [Naematelia encephala]
MLFTTILSVGLLTLLPPAEAGVCKASNNSVSSAESSSSSSSWSSSSTSSSWTDDGSTKVNVLLAGDASPSLSTDWSFSSSSSVSSSGTKGPKKTSASPAGTAASATGAVPDTSLSNSGSVYTDKSLVPNFATFYDITPEDNKGACGDNTLSASGHTVALNQPMYDKSGKVYPNPNCGKEIVITATKSGVNHTATIADECPLIGDDGCHWGSLDMTTGLWDLFNSESGGQFDGIFDISWTCADCVDFPS